LFLAALFAQMPGLSLRPVTYDEGLTLVGAARIVQGEVPYRDFWNTHTPGQITVLALLFRLFGPSMMIARAFDITVRAALTVLLFLLARCACPRGVAFLVWAAGVLFLAAGGAFGYTMFAAMFLSLAGLLLTVRALDSKSTTTTSAWSGFVTAGLVAGLGFLFRHDLGAAGALAAATTLLLGRLSDPPNADEAGSRLALGFRDLARFSVGVGVVVLPVLGLFLALGTPMARLVEIFITFPLLVYPKVRSLPFPPLGANLALRLLPLATAAVAFAVGLVRLRREPSTRRTTLTLIGLALLILLTSPVVLVRPSYIHQLPIRFPALALLPGLWCVISDALRLPRVLVWLGPLALVPFLLPPAAAAVATVRGFENRRQEGTSHGLARAWGVSLAADQVAVVKTVQALVPPSAPLFVGLARHDRVFANDALFYFLAERRSATYYHNLLPGLVTTERVQREMVGELERDIPPVIVLFTGNETVQEPNESRLSSGVTLLDEYLRASYRLAETIGRYQIWTRR
jgi:hypothetical protein